MKWGARAWLLALGVGVPLVSAFCVVSVHRSVMGTQLKAIQDQFLTQAQLERLMVDQQTIASSGLFPARSNAHDAGVLLNPVMGLDGGEPIHQQAISWPWWAAPALREQTKGPRADRLPPARRPWLVSPEYMRKGDLSILEKLMAYDHWEVSSPGGRYAEYLALDDHPFLPDSPIPNFVGLQTLVRLRLAVGLAAGTRDEMLTALREVRHLARLCESTEGLVPSMVAISLLAVEGRAAKMAVAREIISVDDWTPISDPVKQALRRAAFGMVVVASGWTHPQDAAAQLDALGIPLFGQCAGLSEAVVQHHLMFPFWNTVPGELGFAFLGAPLEAKLSQASECRLPVARDVMAHPERMNMRYWTEGSSIGASGISGSQKRGKIFAIPFLRGPSFLAEGVYAGAVDTFRLYGSTFVEDWPSKKKNKR
jgi:hypothetical protein